MKAPLFIFLLLGVSLGGLRAELRAGAALSDISPKPGVSLDGTISQNGPVESVHDPLHARCPVLDDGKTRLAFAIVDSTMISDAIIDDAKTQIGDRLGLPGSNVIVAATHSHSTPRAVIGLKDDPLFVEYLDMLPDRIAEGVIKAAENLAPARIGWASGEEPRHVHNRRWFTEGAEEIPNPLGEKGEKVRMNPGRKGLIKPAGPVDPEVYVLSVQHADGRPLALLANYGLHYVGGGKRGEVSADYFAMFANRMEELLEAGGQEPPFVGILTNGTSGDINANDYSQPREKFEPYERMKLVADHVAGKAFEAYRGIEYFRDVTLAAEEKVLELGVRKPDAARLAWAKENAAPPENRFRLNRTQVYAREALALAEYPDEVRVRIQAFRIGDLGIVSIPCEVFAETGLAIKAESPFEDTFVIELANGYHGYLPTPKQHEWGGYETWSARSAYLEERSEPRIRAAALELLREVK